MDINNKTIVIELIESFRGRLHDDWLNEYLGDASCGEWGMALENLCFQLEEFDISVTVQQYEIIRTACERMKIDPQRWKCLTVEAQR